MSFLDLIEKEIIRDNSSSSLEGSNDLKWSLITATSIADFIKTTFGPLGGDKLIVDENGNIIVTNDGYTILKYLSKPTKDFGDNIDNNRNQIFNQLNEEQQQQQQQQHQQLKIDNTNNNDNNNESFSKKSKLNRIKFQAIIELLMDCCKTQERSFGDGTTSVLVMIGALASNALKLIFEKGIKPHLVSKGYQIAMNLALKELDHFYLNVDLDQKNNSNNNDNNYNINLQKVAESSLHSKSVSYYKSQLSKLCINAIQSISNNNNNNFNENNDDNSLLALEINNNNNKRDLKRIKMIYKEGGSIEETNLINGIVLEKFFSHENMPKSIQNARILVLSCPLEVPKPKTNSEILISNPNQYNQLLELKNRYYKLVERQLQRLNVNFIACQWGFDPEINSMLSRLGISALSWVPGDQLQRIALATDAFIVSDLIGAISISEEETEELDSNQTVVSESMIGKCEEINEIVIGNNNERLTVFERCKNRDIVCILVRGGSEQMCLETIQCIRDCLHVVDGCMSNPRVVCGGGATEFYIYNKLLTNSIITTIDNSTSSNYNNDNNNNSIIEYSIKSWIDSLLSIPIALLENTGFDSKDLLLQLIKLHQSGDPKYSTYGINLKQYYSFPNTSSDNSGNCGGGDKKEEEEEEVEEKSSVNEMIGNMKSMMVLELLDLKKSIIKLSTETICMLLQIDTCISL
eukprot:gene4309-5394_t